MKGFELFMGRLGNGITLANKLDYDKEIRDYRTVGHITDYGIVTIYVPKSYIPVKELEKIRQVALQARKIFLEQRKHVPVLERYENVLMELPLRYFLVLSKAGWSLEEILVFGESCLFGCFEEEFDSIKENIHNEELLENLRKVVRYTEEYWNNVEEVRFDDWRKTDYAFL